MTGSSRLDRETGRNACRAGLVIFGVWAFWLAAVTTGEAQDAESLPEPDEAKLAEELRAILIQREEAVTSFRAEYTLRQTNTDPESGTNWEDVRERLVFRDPDVRRDIWRPDGRHRVRARLLGVRIELSEGEDGPVGARVSHEPYTYPTPYQGGQVMIDPRLVLFGFVHGEPLRDRFANGSLKGAMAEDARRRLTWHENGTGSRIDFYLDDKGRLVQMDVGLCATVATSPAIADLIKEFGEDQFFRIEWSLHMSEFTEIDGIPVPMLATRTYWEQDANAGAAALARFEETGRLKRSRLRTGSIIEKVQNKIHSARTGLPEDGLTPLERQRRTDVITLFQTETPSAGGVLEMRIEPDSVAINPVVQDDDFRVEVPEGIRVFGDAALLDLSAPSEKPEEGGQTRPPTPGK